MRLAIASFVFATAVLAQEPQIGDQFPIRPDVRIVNGIQVDLTPIHAWLRTREGERPMKHWRQFQVFNMTANLGGLDRCTVKTEEGSFAEMLIKNLTRETR